MVLKNNNGSDQWEKNKRIKEDNVAGPIKHAGLHLIHTNVSWLHLAREHAASTNQAFLMFTGKI